MGAPLSWTPGAPHLSGQRTPWEVFETRIHRPCSEMITQEAGEGTQEGSSKAPLLSRPQKGQSSEHPDQDPERGLPTHCALSPPHPLTCLPPAPSGLSSSLPSLDWAFLPPSLGLGCRAQNMDPVSPNQGLADLHPEQGEGLGNVGSSPTHGREQTETAFNFLKRLLSSREMGS